MAWLYIPGAEVDDPVMQAEDIGFDYIDPNPMGSKLTEFFQTVEKKNWLDIDGVTFSEGDTVLTLSTCCRKYDKANSGNPRLGGHGKAAAGGGNRAGVQRIPCG